MTRRRLPHLEVPAARAGFDVSAALAQEPDFTGSAADERVVALEALDAH